MRRNTHLICSVIRHNTHLICGVLIVGLVVFASFHQISLIDKQVNAVNSESGVQPPTEETFVKDKSVREKPKANVNVNTQKTETLPRGKFKFLKEKAVPHVKTNSLKEKTFQHVQIKKNSFVINMYSGYTIFVHTNTTFLDLRDPHRATLRMFGYLVTRKNHVPYFKCMITRKGRTSSVIGLGKLITINDEFRGPMNRTAHLICSLPKEARLKGVSVIFNGTSGDIAEVKRVGENLDTATKPKGFAICLPTLYGLSSPYVVAEWMEMQRLFGISQVFLYDKYDTAPEVDQILNHYAKIGFLKFVYWNKPWRTAQFAHGHDTILNHCLYNLMEEFEYLGVYDLDEFLIPKIKKDGDTFVKIYPDLMNLLTSKTPSLVVGYTFGRKLICLSDKNVKATDHESLRATNLVMSEPETNYKTINRPLEITALAIHEPVGYRPLKRRKDIRDDVGLIYHYKKKASQCGSEDNSVLVYSDVIQSAIRDVFRTAGISYK